VEKPVASGWIKPACHDCNQRVYISREGFWEHYEPPDGEWIWHLDCRAPWLT